MLPDAKAPHFPICVCICRGQAVPVGAHRQCKQSADHRTPQDGIVGREGVREFGGCGQKRIFNLAKVV